MANIGFGLEINKYAKQTGFDQFSTDLSDVLAETAKDAWKYNPVSSSLRLYELNQSRNVDEPLIPFQELNKKYKDSGIFFEQDEKQSTVDVLVERKKEERDRQSIIQRGPTGVVATTAKFGTAMVASIADPINLAMMFIPVVGQVRFASLVAKYGLTKARMMKGSLEGLTGIAAVEPLVYGAAKAEQSDYGLMDSFMAVSFGTILGGGLHVGAGKLKDKYTHRKFKKRIRESRKNLKSKSQEDPAFSLYREYYPENSRIMKELAETNPDVRRTLLAKALSDLGEDIDVNVKDVADLDPKLRNAQLNEKVSPNEKVNPKNQVDEDINFKRQEITSEDTTASRTKNSLEQKAQEEYEVSNAKEDIELRNIDEEVSTVESQLNILKDRQKDLGIKDNDDVKLTTKEAEEFTTKEKEIKDAIIDGINCFNGR